MKTASIITGAILFLYSILGLIQLWTSFMSWENFAKISITAAVIIIVAVGISLLYREYIETTEFKKDNFID
jgi:multisubunit Na+/H+ antiporter MnhG subunit